MSAVAVWKPCKKCGSTKDADTQCSHCGGYGMVTGARYPYHPAFDIDGKPFFTADAGAVAY